MIGHAWVVCRSCNNPVELALCVEGAVRPYSEAVRAHLAASPSCSVVTAHGRWHPTTPARFAELRAYVYGMEATG